MLERWALHPRIDEPHTHTMTREKHARHQASPNDAAFLRAFEACETAPSQFNHRAHVRLAYIYHCDWPIDEAYRRMRRSLLAYLRQIGAGESKYHETTTRAWLLAVAQFMAATPACRSAARFIECNPALLDTRIMLSHYSRDLLFSEAARSRFVEPDRQPIPEH